MKIKLTMTRQQYQALLTIAGNILRALEGEDFETVQARDALYGLLHRTHPRLLLLGDSGNRLTLSDIEAWALYNGATALADRFMPYEHATALWLLEQTDLQRMDYLRQIRANMGANSNQLSVISEQKVISEQ